VRYDEFYTGLINEITTKMHHLTQPLSSFTLPARLRFHVRPFDLDNEELIASEECALPLEEKDWKYKLTFLNLLEKLYLIYVTANYFSKKYIFYNFSVNPHGSIGTLVT